LIPLENQWKHRAMRFYSHTSNSHIPSAALAGGWNLPAKVTPMIGHDPLMERLVRALLPDDEANEMLRGFYADTLHATLLKHSAARRDDADADSGRRKSMALPRWRLKRVFEHVEANLGDRLPLTALAQAAGLNRMYFAEQFRAATGLRPHDYVVRRRIRQAQAMLAGTDMPIVDVALSVGFQTQAHFTTVFKRVAGATPRHWRSARGDDSRETHKVPRMGWGSEPKAAVRG
jgi:AraC-like DNA-binding protein